MKGGLRIGHRSIQSIDWTSEPPTKSLFHVVRHMNSKSLVTDFEPSSLNDLPIHAAGSAVTRPSTPVSDSKPATDLSEYLLGRRLSQRLRQADEQAPVEIASSDR